MTTQDAPAPPRVQLTPGTWVGIAGIVPDDIARAAVVEVGSLAVSLTVVKWMVGFMPGLRVATIALLFQIALRLG